MQFLERASHGYRIGYLDAFHNRPRKTNMKDGIETPFVGTDYANGYDAGFNDVYWNAVRENEKRA